MTTYYDILGVAPTASADDIKAAYRQLAMQFHPDKTPGANKAVQRLIEDKFKEIQEAYDTLKDEAKRAEYDEALAMLQSDEYYEPPPPPPPPPPPKPRYCPRCHKAVPTGAPTTDSFCTFCSASLQSPPRPPNREQPQPPPPPPQAKPAYWLKVPGWVGITVLVGLLSVIPVGWVLGGFLADSFKMKGDDAGILSCFIIALPVVLLICFTAFKMKHTIPAILFSSLYLFLMAAVAISAYMDSSPQHPVVPVRVAQPHTAEPQRVEVRSATQNASPQPSRSNAGVLNTTTDVSKWLANHRNEQALITFGDSLRDNGDFDGAIGKYREALRLSPADGKLHSDLGWAYEQKGDVDNAIAEYDAALRLNSYDNFSRAGLNRLVDKRVAQPQTMKTDARMKETNPRLTGTFSGTVHNLKSGLTADFKINLEENGGRLLGCMAVRDPLYGSGSLSGGVRENEIQFDVTSLYMQIHFNGKVNGGRLSGTYHVIAPPQDGQFELTKSDSKGLPQGFDTLKDCPTDADTHR